MGGGGGDNLKYNQGGTCEPIEHLAGAEDYIARFIEERNAAS